MRFGPVWKKIATFFSEKGAGGVRGRSEIFRKFIDIGKDGLPLGAKSNLFVFSHTVIITYSVTEGGGKKKLLHLLPKKIVIVISFFFLRLTLPAENEWPLSSVLA